MSTPTPGTPPTPRTRTHVVIVIDRSGSMGSLQGFVVEEANRFLEQLDPADVVTIAQFDGHAPYDLLVDGLPAAEVTPITHDQYEPRGSTPLYDAVGTAITRTAGVVARDAVLGVETSVVLGIITDGFENSSTEYTERQVSDLVEHHQDRGWRITYVGLGLGEATHAASASLKVRRSKSLAYSKSGSGLRASFEALRSDVAESRAPRPTAGPGESGEA